MIGSAVEIGLALVVIGLTVFFGLAFKNHESAKRSLARMRGRAFAFRNGILLIVLGITSISEADALRWMASLQDDHPAYMIPLVAGYALVICGIALLDHVLWRASSEAQAAPA